MKIDRRVIKLLDANCKTFRWDVSKLICVAMLDHVGKDFEEVEATWKALLDELLENDGVGGKQQ